MITLKYCVILYHNIIFQNGNKVRIDGEIFIQLIHLKFFSKVKLTVTLSQQYLSLLFYFIFIFKFSIKIYEREALLYEMRKKT